MEIIIKIFNFNNIGSKIKNLAKWFCWIAILFIWSFSAVAFVGLLLTDDASYCWIPIVCALIGPFAVWFSCWMLYGFGELVESASCTEYNTNQILTQLSEEDCDSDDETTEE